MSKWTIIGRRTWSYGYRMMPDGAHAPIVVTETTNNALLGETSIHRWTATICGYGNWKLGVHAFDGRWDMTAAFQRMRDKAERIRERILASDEAVFTEPNEWEVL